ncbi:glycosyltransferase family 8 protein [Phanerochaete sordida]|uniref:Glycosyltransferase family 8 protein n=1 Tax=Phanerochaete sordida TaxID=48140 RepID=A0A9P3GTJ2_9APHY|nr:glycosyltransferase family 8 protein [Phanerochaete sordida]
MPNMRLARYLPRYRNYIPLEPRDGLLLPKPTLLQACFAGVFAFSLLLNIIHFFRPIRTLPSPLDDYQQLKRYPMLNQSAIPPLSEDDWRGAAIVTTLYSDSYAPAVATLGHSLQLVNTSARMIMMYIPSQISPEALCLATASGFVAHPVERIAPPGSGRGIRKQFVDQYTKLRLWTLDTLSEPVRRAVYIDSDTLVLHSLDELFALPYAFAAGPDVWAGDPGFTLAFNAGVLFLRPDSALFGSLVAALGVARYPPAFAEQAFLNQFFATDVLRLPLAYNGNLAIKQRAPKVWESLQDELRVLHYTVNKPFLYDSSRPVPLDRLADRVRESAEEYKGVFREEMLMWGDMWRETRRVYSDKLRECMIFSSFPDPENDER